MSINQTLKLALIPLDITWADADENRFAVRRIVEKLPRDVDVVLLPEMFTTGYVTRKELCAALAEKWTDSATVKFLKTLAKENNMALCGSVLIDSGGEKAVNRCVFVEPSGEVEFYDKRHLFCLGEESRNLMPGKLKSPVIRFRGWNIAMSVCYDIRFPVWNRNVDNRYDLLIVPANWPSSRGRQWKQMLIGRAIENQSYVAGVNRSGKDDFGDYDDLSFVFDYVGEPAGEPAGDGDVVIATLDKVKLNKLRRHFPVVEDADSFIIEV